jgi:hypothetical protein
MRIIIAEIWKRCKSFCGGSKSCCDTIKLDKNSTNSLILPKKYIIIKVRKKEVRP